MNEREWEQVKKLITKSAEPVTEIVSVVRETTSQVTAMCETVLRLQMNQQALYEKMMMMNNHREERIVSQLLAVCTPQAAKLSANLHRAGGAGVVGPTPVAPQQSLPTPPPAPPAFLDDEIDNGEGKREPIDMMQVLADSTHAQSPVAFQPPFPIAPPTPQMRRG